MDCCGHGHEVAPRHGLWSMAATPVGAMLAGAGGPRGFTPEEAGKIAGGNYMRIFRAAVG